MKKSLIGYGSIFHKNETAHVTTISNTTFLGEHELFYAGRYAIKYVIFCILEQLNIDHIWLPNYYCPYVKNWLEQEFKAIKYYDIDPFDADAHIDWSPFSPTDLVIANNFWGLKELHIPIGSRPLIIEDHSHGWLSKGCVDSNADFCIASLRKTLPIPLGGIAWKPKKGTCNIPLKFLKKMSAGKDTNPMLKSWELIDGAMAAKATCTHEEEKIEFLLAYSQGETLLRNTQEIVPVLPEHEQIMLEHLFKNFNVYKKDNLSLILRTLEPSNTFKVLSCDDRIPFGLLLAFKDWEMLCNFKQFLITNHIYPAELWPQNRIVQDYKFLLNIHIDYRYNGEDLEYMSKIINQWTLKQSTVDLEENL